MINVYKSVLQCLCIVSVLSLTGERISFYGTKGVINGNEFLMFNCSSTTKPVLPYAEFLINGNTSASVIYDEQTNKCVLGQSKYNCTNLCECSSDGKTFTWTFPLPSSQRMVYYSCHMFINSKHQYEVAHLKYNGTDFASNILENQPDTTGKRTTTEIVPGSDDENAAKQTDLLVPLLIISTILVISIVVFGISCCVKKPTNRKRKDMWHGNDYSIYKASDENEKGIKAPLMAKADIEVGSMCQDRTISKAGVDAGTMCQASTVSTEKKEDITCGKASGENTEEATVHVSVFIKTGVDAGTMCQASTVSTETQYDVDNNECGTEGKDNCDICKLLGKNRRAKTKCMICVETMCLTCGDIHQAMKVTSQHKLIQIDKIPKNFVLPSTCTTHSQPLEYICKYHDRLCCKLCIGTCGENDKGKCDFEVIDDKTGDFESSKLFNHYSFLAKQLPTLVSSLIYHIYQNIDELGKSPTHTVDKNNSYRIKCLQLIAKETENINDALNNVLNNLEFVENNALDKFHYLMFHSSVPMFDNITEKLKSILSKTKDIELMDRSHNRFLSFKDIEDTVQNLESSPNLKQSQVAIKM